MFAAAYKSYSPSEYDFMREAGADSVRMNVAQDGANPDNHKFYDRRWFDQVMDAIGAARRAGLVVIVSIQDETQTGVKTKAPLPNAGTRRVWEIIAPRFAHDRGVLFELYNEPNVHPDAPIDVIPSAADWAEWKAAMDQTLAVVRRAGATNVVVADGLASAQQLTGAPDLDDPLRQVAYASHPYPNNGMQQTEQSWNKKFGTFAAQKPVIVTEWGIGYYCDSNTPNATTTFLSYLDHLQVGLEAVAWDWPAYSFASAVQDYPNTTFSSLLTLTSPTACSATTNYKPGQGSGVATSFGPGRAIRTWYRTGRPPAAPE